MTPTVMHETDASRGFTLIELMVVLLIVAIIAAVAYPSYRSYVLKSHRTDATTALMDAAQQLERCYTEYNTYTDPSCQAYTDINGSYTSDQGYYVIGFGTPAPTSDTYKLVATPTTLDGQNDDTGCKTLMLDQTGKKSSTGTSTDCW